ncbi:MAG: hypothetical protein V3T58_05225 [Candidatus Hydrothermarchaeales archaeon]
MRLILDTSALLAGARPSKEEKCYTVPKVMEEVRERKAKLALELSLQARDIKLLEPSERALTKAGEAARESGDIAQLSQCDIQLIALAIDFKETGKESVILTDDYSIQNLSKKLGVSFVPIAEMGIKKYLSWKNICKGCGKKFPIEYKGKCDHCGSEVIRKAKRRKR